MERPSLRAIARTYLQIGNSTFGSGSATMIRLGQALTRLGWIGPAQFDLNYTLARLAPGTNVMAFVMGTGYAVRGWAGGVVALIALSIPASCVVVLLTLAYQKWNDHPLGHAIIGSAMSAITGIIVGAAWLLAWPRFRRTESWRTLVLVAGSATLSFWLPPLQVMLAGAVVGYFWPGHKR